MDTTYKSGMMMEVKSQLSSLVLRPYRRGGTIRALVFLAIRLTGIPFLLRVLRQRNTVTILCYHDPSPDVVEAHLRVLEARYNIITLRQYINWRTRQSEVPLPRYALVITLDDGHRGNVKLASVFKKHGVRPTIFLCSAIVGTHRRYWWQARFDHEEMVRLTRVPDEKRLQRLAEVGFREEGTYQERQSLSTTEIAALKDVFDFQSHTRLHPVLPECTIERAAREIGDSKTELERNFDLTIYALAFPNGDYSEREISMARDVGYTCALNLDGGYNFDDTQLFQLRRLRLSDDSNENELIVKASGLWRLFERFFSKRRVGYVRTGRAFDDARTNK